MKDGRKNILKILVGMAGFSVTVLCVLCIVFLFPIKSNTETIGATLKFTHICNPLRTIVYAAEFSNPDEVLEASASAVTVNAVDEASPVALEMALNVEDTTKDSISLDNVTVAAIKNETKTEPSQTPKKTEVPEISDRKNMNTGQSSLEEVIVITASPASTPQPSKTEEVPEETPKATAKVTQKPVENTTNTVPVSTPQVQDGKYEIMGQTQTTVAQMVRYFTANAQYPSFYANTDAPTIEAFCQIFYDEANIEGVKAEVAFCQTMKETGYLKFGGDVSISQFNFAGLGATGNGVAGNCFSSVREGVRAQIQHLKAYASTEPLNQTCVDTRFKYVKRGTAVYVEWLGIKENPNGGGWAASQGYGTSIVNSYIKKLFTY